MISKLILLTLFLKTYSITLAPFIVFSIKKNYIHKIDFDNIKKILYNKIDNNISYHNSFDSWFEKWYIFNM